MWNKVTCHQFGLGLGVKQELFSLDVHLKPGSELTSQTPKETPNSKGSLTPTSIKEMPGLEG